MRAFLGILIATFILGGARGEPAPAALPPGTTKVIAVAYHYEADPDRRDIMANGTVHPGLLEQHTRTLGPDDIALLLDAMTGKHTERQRLLCDFAPHHGIIFRNDSDQITGSISICFTCRELTSDRFGSSDPFVTRWNWAKLKELFTKNGIPLVLPDYPTGSSKK